MSVDPLAAKYPGWSPYNYCINNPLTVIDPDGKTIWIKEIREDGSEHLVKYVPGMKANSKKYSSFMKKVIRELNSIGQKMGGSEVVNSMSNAKNADFTFSNKNPENKEAAGDFHRDDKKGGAFYVKNNPTDGTIAHELFHGYVELQGFGGGSIWDEVQAYAFEFIMTGTPNHFGRTDDEGRYIFGDAQSYQDAMENFIKNNDIQYFNNAIDSFRKGSEANRTSKKTGKGPYDKFELRIGAQSGILDIFGRMKK